MTAMAAPIRQGNGPVIGVVTIAGPLVRLTPERMQALGPALLNTTHELAMASAGSPLLKKRG
jgi:DNA-binding IclR family transcriptional regulator